MPAMRYPSRRAVRALFASLIATTACFLTSTSAQTGPELLVKPFDKDVNYEINASAIFQKTGEDDFGGGNDLGVNVYEVSARAREVRENYIPRFGFEMAYLDIRDTNDILPEHLIDQSVAAGVALPNNGHFIGGQTVGLGYAGDGPFGDGNAWYAKATAAFGKKLDENTEIGIFLDYDGNRTYLPDVPLPGFAYRKRLDQKLQLVAGAPLSSVEWTPDDKWKFELFFTLIETFDARITYKVAPHFNVFGALESRRWAFHMDELEDQNDRLLFTQRRAEVGAQWEPRKDARVIVAGGYAFGQTFSAGFDFRDDDEVTDVTDEPYVRAGLELRF
jgi:hypothetical protein